MFKCWLIVLVFYCCCCNKLLQPWQLQTNSLSYSFIGQKFDSSLIELHSGCLWGCFPTGISGGEFISLPFPLLGPPTFLGSQPPFSNFKASDIAPCWTFLLWSEHALTTTGKVLHFQEFTWLDRAHLSNLKDSPHLRFLGYITSAKSLCREREHSHRFLRLGLRHLEGWCGEWSWQPLKCVGLPVCFFLCANQYRGLEETNSHNKVTVSNIALTKPFYSPPF